MVFGKSKQTLKSLYKEEQKSPKNTTYVVVHVALLHMCLQIRLWYYGGFPLSKMINKFARTILLIICFDFETNLKQNMSRRKSTIRFNFFAAKHFARYSRPITLCRSKNLKFNFHYTFFLFIINVFISSTIQAGKNT